MFKSAHAKLTIWYLAIMMAISLVFSIVLYNIASSQLASELKRQSERLYNKFPAIDNAPILHLKRDLSYGDHIILLRIITLNIIVLISAGFASYLLAKRTLRPIEEAHEQQQLFTANVSHELRTPLTALKMESEVALLNEQATVNTLKETIHSNLEEIEKIESLINNILKLTKLETEELRSNFVPQSVNKIIIKSIEGINIIAKDRKIKLTFIKNTNYKIMGDEESLIQLLIILLDNAIKYSSNGQSVIIETKKVNKQVIITIIDNGQGIKKEELAHIFDRFYRADKSRSKTTSGYGLGLPIAKMIADLHDGTIIVNSKENSGTTIKISLPIYTIKN